MINELETDPKTALKNVPAAVVAFCASWCTDCKESEDYEKKLAEEFKDKLRFYRFDAVNHEDVADRYHIEHYPTYIFFRKGREVRGILVCPYSESELRNWLESKLGRSAYR